MTYRIRFDPDRAMLVIAAEGFWDRSMLDRFGDELLREMRALGATGKRFTVLADAREFPVQSIPVSAGFMGIVNRIEDGLLVPTAIVTGGGLLKLQALRVLVAPHIRVFNDYAAALAWLTESRTGMTEEQ
ncbi:hypothetical protein [Sphingomonas sp. EC-HK361]|uniref:hypothetical protein n=1 Tax=Sphingomonas sp. EC-HK361 TaxID=2038397 RepID=UPI00125F24CA|nr:hypothetical protein [Sphingomonas sp. EC-HK361]